ncbi:MAG: 2-C-methyl-D-erythritol 4-phosphate cytidylyltransferase [Pirellulaceae bacterium]|nr:2-C-methyl-D-erythritol 4-phosphate cytidylyltransferase [Pirellulaceae bacterium]
MNQDTAVILAAAGKSSRFGQPFLKKVYALLGGKPVFQHSATTFSGHPAVAQQLLVVHPDDLDMLRSKFAATFAMMGIEIVLGGDERWQSVENAIAKLAAGIEFVAVHDAARPLVSLNDFDKVLQAAREHGAAILGEPIHGTVKRADANGWIESTVSRERLYQAQTPQVFRRDWLAEAYASRQASHPTDDAQLVEAIGKKVQMVAGSRTNFKITTQEDLRLAEMALKAKSTSR